MACETLLARHPKNPLIGPADVPGGAASIFNSAAVRFGDGYVGVFRVEHHNQFSKFHLGRSADGVDWTIEGPIAIDSDDPDFAPLEHTYDPRVTVLEDRYWITYANHDSVHGSRIGLAVTDDFETFRQVGNLSPAHNRNCVLFPEKVGGTYARLERPYAPVDTPAEMWYAESPDLIHWGRWRPVMRPMPGWSEWKVGAGAPPLRTEEGWLIIYHGVHRTADGSVYTMGAALLDLERPWILRARPENYLLAPTELYERVGDVMNVVFPCAAIAEPDGELKVYYGAADTTVCLATGQLDALVAWCLESEPVTGDGG